MILVSYNQLFTPVTDLLFLISDVNQNDGNNFDVVSPIVSVGEDECLVCGQCRNYIMDLRNLKRLKHHLDQMMGKLHQGNALMH